MLVDLLVDVATLIESTITVNKVAVTLPEPPSSDDCSAAYVWGVQLYDADVSTQSRGDIAGCTYKRAYQINYRIDFCITVTERERTTAEQLTEATELYNAADQVFCALMANASSGTLFDAVNVEDCEDINVQPLVLNQPTGDRVSATGQILVTDPCEPEGS